jgi:PA domain
MPNLLRFRRSLLVVAVAVLFIAASTPLQQADPARYLNDIKSLASPEMEGRGAGTKGLTRAQHLIEKRYKELGIPPAGVNGYAQPFSVITGARLKADNSFNIATGNDSKNEITINHDFVPYSFSASGQVSAPLVFAGYGITADEFHYDDYAGIDVKDKVVVVLRYEPASFAQKNGNNGLTQHSQLISKAINARNHGAKAVVVLNGKLGDGEEDLLTRFGSVSGPENVGIVTVQVKNAVAESWFQSAGKSLKDVQDQINSSTKPASFAFPDSLHASLHIDIETTRATVNNVLAWLPGQTDEYVIIGAHYDHLGRGNFDSLAPS